MNIGRIITFNILYSVNPLTFQCTKRVLFLPYYSPLRKSMASDDPHKMVWN